MKKCIRCNLEKPLYQFNKNKRSIDGRYKVCIKCRYGYDNELQSETDKRCKKCGIIKHQEDFYFISKKYQTRDCNCKDCDNIIRAERGGYKIRELTPTRRYNNWVSSLKNKYNLTVDEYNNYLTQQDNKCKICNNPYPLVVDHCHASGKVRGLLCNGCNTALGNFKDNINFLNSAILYLQEKLPSCKPG